jgi:hypothetical protein
MSDKKNNNNVYWHCVVGPVNKNELPEAFDSPMRMGLHKVLERSNLKGYEMYSGWGISDKKAKLLNFLASAEDDMLPTIKQLATVFGFTEEDAIDLDRYYND